MTNTQQIQGLTELFRVLGVSPKNFIEESIGSTPEVFEELLLNTRLAFEKAVISTVQVEKLDFWGTSFLPHQIHADWRNRASGHKYFLDMVLTQNTEQKLRNFTWNAESIKTQHQAFELVALIKRLQNFLRRSQPLTQYLDKARIVLRHQNSWINMFDETKKQLLTQIDDPKNYSSIEFYQNSINKLESLKAEYKNEYIQFHQQNLSCDQNRASKLIYALDEEPYCLNCLKGVCE